MKIGDEVYIHGFVDEIRKDTVIIRNKGGYFGTDAEEVAPTVEPIKVGDVCKECWREGGNAVERKRGRWRHYEGYLTCSECGVEYDDGIMTYCGDDVPKFCPNCGADIEVYVRCDQEEETE